MNRAEWRRPERLVRHERRGKAAGARDHHDFWTFV